MSDSLIISELFRELSVEQQEYTFGGTDFKLSNTNFAEKDDSSLQSNAGNFMNNSNFSVNSHKVVNTAGQGLLGLDGNIPRNIATLPPPIIF